MSTWCPRRHILGLIAVAALAVGVIVGCYPSLAPQATGDMGLRIGLIAGVFWLAWPDLDRLPLWVWYVLPVGVVVLIYARGVLIFLIPALGTATALYLLYRKVWGRSPH